MYSRLRRRNSLSLSGNYDEYILCDNEKVCFKTTMRPGKPNSVSNCTLLYCKKKEVLVRNPAHRCC